MHLNPGRLSISTHAPRTGSDYCGGKQQLANARFQPTLPARGATLATLYNFDKTIFISTHAPRTGSDSVALSLRLCCRISTHAPRTGSDTNSLYNLTTRPNFNPRSPHGERRGEPGEISPEDDFNPRSPHGERQRKVTILSIRIIGFAQKVYHKTVLLRISLAENAVILPKRPQNPVRTSLQRAGGLRFARAIRAARPYSISSPSGA